jgi:diguanylate cyclase (GGDEF)-like protein
MGTASRFDPSSFPDSPYAVELQRDPANLRFSPQLERDYARSQLTDSRPLIRVASLFAVAIAVLRGIELAARGAWSASLLINFTIVTAGSLLLAAIAWGASFERLYLPWARIIVPLRNIIVAAYIAGAAVRGQAEMLTALPLMLIGPFFFFGFRFRTAALTGVLTVLSYIVFALYFRMATPLALRSFAFLIAAVIAGALAARHFEKKSRKDFLEDHLIADLAQHDPLTGTKNRRVFDDHLIRLWQQAIEDGRTIGILLIDVDHFKAYNDRYGHLAGDQALRRVAQTIQRFVRRPLDLLARYGGEEFAAILYDVEAGHAKDMAERMCKAIADLAIEHRDSRTAAGVTISVGVAVVEPTEERLPRGAVQLADQALYEAKVKGRNRVEVMDSAQYRMLVTGVFAKPSLVGKSTAT